MGFMRMKRNIRNTWTKRKCTRKNVNTSAAKGPLKLNEQLTSEGSEDILKGVQGKGEAISLVQLLRRAPEERSLER